MKDFVEKFATLIIGAFSLLAALAWNETIKAFVQKYISPGSDFKSMLIYASIVTVIAVFVSVYLTKITKKVIKQEEKIKKEIEKLKKQVEEDKEKKNNL